VDRALIVKKPWIDLILSGQKIWEMRSRRTLVRGKIGLIEQGSGLIVGECELIHSGMRIDQSERELFKCYHRVEDLSLLEKWRYPWVLKNAKRYETPIKYKHPKGAVTWVKIGA
jgi:hypothetical protein